MKQPIRIFLLLISLFLASCDCNNSNTGNVPKDEKEDSGPKLSLRIAEGVKQEDLYNNRPIRLVLKDENFSKHDIKKFKVNSKLSGDVGFFHLVDAHGKAGEHIANDTEIELKDGSLPLIFIPSGKAGKNPISLDVYYQGAWNKINLELDLQEGNPKFSLVLAEEINQEELFANRPIGLVLKDENFTKHDIKQFKVRSNMPGDMGALHLMDAHGKAWERITDNDTEIELKDVSLPLIFVPIGKAGKQKIHMEVYYKDSWNKVSIELDLKSFISLEGPEKMKTSKIATAYLKINADPEEEFTLKSVRIDYYPLEMIYDNGEEQGIWSEVKNVHIGDKFKGGEHELSLKLYGENDKLGDEIYQGDKSKVRELESVDEWIHELGQEIPKYWFRPVSLDMVLVDKQGDEYKVKTEFEVEDISFEVELGGIDWGIYNARNSKEFREGIFKFKARVKYGNAKIYNQSFKILSFTSNDGSAVSLVDYNLHRLIGKTLLGDSYDLDNLYFRFDDINLDFVGKPTMLTLKLQGPGGIVKSADLIIGADERELIFWRKIEWIRHRGSWLSGELGDSVKYKRASYDAQECGKEAIEFLEQVKFIATQINPAFLSKYFSPYRLKEIESALEWISFIKKDLEDLNKEFGFNFVSPM